MVEIPLETERANQFSKQRDFVSTVVKGHTFTISSKYNLSKSKVLGAGAFGIVITAFDPLRKKEVAVKRVRPYAEALSDAMLTLREIRLMKHLGSHPNIISLYEVSLFEPKSELYFVMELLDGDLHKVISRSKQPLTERHLKCFMKQLLEGINAMHSVGVFHRDLKPANILISKNCELRISDFGWSRYMHESTRWGENRANPMTEYIITRWYRSPELLVSPKNLYDEKVDIWSIGCILAELVLRKPLFPGTSFTDQVIKILNVFGYSDPKELGVPIKAENIAFLNKHCRGPPKALSELFPFSSPDLISLIQDLLILNPYKRPTAEEALRHAFLRDAETFYDYSQKYLSPIPPEQFDFEVRRCSINELKGLIKAEVSVSQQPSPPTRIMPDLDVATSPFGSASASASGDAEDGPDPTSQQKAASANNPNQSKNNSSDKKRTPPKKENPFRSKTERALHKAGAEDEAPSSADNYGNDIILRAAGVVAAEAETVPRFRTRAGSDLSDTALSDIEQMETQGAVQGPINDGDFEDCPFDKPLEYSDSETEKEIDKEKEKGREKKLLASAKEVLKQQSDEKDDVVRGCNMSSWNDECKDGKGENAYESKKGEKNNEERVGPVPIQDRQEKAEGLERSRATVEPSATKPTPSSTTARRERLPEGCGCSIS